ncbi:hypothetical protein PHYC_03792 [Phycisphaerales bacterium]|nr:hypothetical protein PHYC_03792 [Phycisphaerales bacterium]
MKKGALFGTSAALALAAAAFAQPAVIEDLGSLPAGVTSRSGAIAAGGQVDWYQFTLASAVQMSDLSFLNADTVGAGFDTELAVYDAAGNLMATDDDDAVGLQSALSFGSGDATFPGTGGAVANGRDGNLPAGTYYVAVVGYNTTFGTTGWTITTGGTATGSYTLNLGLGTASAIGDPSGTIDLGTLVQPQTINRSDPLAASTVQVYKMVVPSVSNAIPNFLDIDTEGTVLAPTNATRLSIYNATGAYMGLTDATDGTGSLSQLSFGQTSPTRPAPGNGVAYNGRDGAIRPGTYYIAAAGPGTAPSTTSTTSGLLGSYTSASANSGTLNLNVRLDSLPIPPTGVPSFTPATCIRSDVGGQGTMRVTVTPGTSPPSTGITVSVDGSALGLGTVTLLDDGAHDDGGAGDNVFGEIVNIGGGYAAGTTQLPFTVADAESRSTTGNLGVTVVAANVAPDELPAGAEVPQGSGALTTLTGSFTPSGAHFFQIEICDSASFSASTVGGSTADTQLFLFDANGMGIAANDDEVAGTSAQSTITSQFVPGNGTYYLAISPYNRDPISNICAGTGALIFQNTFRVEHPANGPGAGSPIVAWTGTTTSTAAYTITLTGACYPGGANPCDVADTNCDGSLNGFDVEATEQAVNGDFSNFCQPSADLNQDGAENGFDVEYSEYLTLNC